MVEPNDVVVGGWDICATPLGDAMKKSKVLDVDLQRQLYDDMQQIVPLPSAFFPSFIAANQRDRADHVLKGSKQEQMDQIRKDICDFKTSNGCDKVIVLWTANTERFAEIQTGVNDTSGNLLAAIGRDEALEGAGRRVRDKHQARDRVVALVVRGVHPHGAACRAEQGEHERRGGRH